MAPTSSVAASPMRKPQAYMTAKQILWVGFLTRRSRLRTCSSVGATGKRFCRGGGAVFFREQRPPAVERVAVEKLNAMLIVLEGSTRDPAVTQGDQVGPNLFLAQRIGRAPIMRRQPPHRRDIATLRPQPQSHQLHVFDHALTQLCHLCPPLVQCRPPPANTKGYTPQTPPPPSAKPPVQPKGERARRPAHGVGGGARRHVRRRSERRPSP